MKLLERVKAVPWARVAGAAAAALVGWALLNAILPKGLPHGIILLGAVYGSLYALGAIGVVLVYRANRVVNFAQAELGSVAAVVAIHLGAQRHWNYFLSVAIGLVLAAAIGAFVDFAVIRRFRNAPRLIVAVATIAIAQILTGASVLLALLVSKGLQTGTFATPFSTETTMSS